MSMFSARDRTNEFRNRVGRYQGVDEAPNAGVMFDGRPDSGTSGFGGRPSFDTSSDKQSLLNAQHDRGMTSHRKIIKNRSQFTKAAGAIGMAIHNTSGKLEQLAKLAQRKSLFDDNSEEIDRLTYVIKQDINELNQQIEALETLYSGSKYPKGKNEQVKKHTGNVISFLKQEMGGQIQEFRNVLEKRTDSIKKQQNRLSHYTAPAKKRPGYSSTQQPQGTGNNMGSNDQVSVTIDTGMGMRERVLDKAGYDPEQERGHQGALQQQQMMQEFSGGNQGYLEQRAHAVETIESTLADMGQIFNRLAVMIDEQGQSIEMIDRNFEDAEMNVDMAQDQLQQHMSNLRSNRGLILKIFFILIVFLILWLAIS